MERQMLWVLVVIAGVQSQLSSPVLVRESETANFRWHVPAVPGRFNRNALFVVSPNGTAVLLANAAHNYQIEGDYRGRVNYTGNLTADPMVMAFDLHSVVRSDAGNYSCGNNGLTDIIPQCGQKLVVVGQPTKPTLTGPSSSVVGRQVTLTCSSTSTTLPDDHGLTLTYTWQRGNTDITVTSPGSPYIFNVSSRDSHSYRCRAKESRGLESEWSQVYNMEPQYGPYAVTLQPSTLSYTRREGQERVPSIRCSATCKPACTYKWFKDGTPHSDGANLTLLVADRSQTGSYKCQASNTHGTVDSSSVTVDVTYVPEVTLNPTCQPHRVYVGQPNAQLICQVTAANPSVTSYIWTHNGSPISSATSREYSLSPVSRSSGGSYTCVGRNSVGTSSVSAVTVEVQFPSYVGIYLTLARGTVRSNRKDFSSSILHSMCVKNQGDMVVTQKGDLVAVTWKDKKVVNLLSMADNAVDICSTVSRKKKDGTAVQISCPTVVKHYNDHINGVDHADQIRTELSTYRTSKKWWHYLFWFAFDVAVSNAFVLMRDSQSHRQMTKSQRTKPRTMLQFRITLSKQLISQLEGVRERRRTSDRDEAGTSPWP